MSTNTPNNNINTLALSFESALRPRHVRTGLAHLEQFLVIEDPLKRIKKAMKSAMDTYALETFNRAYKTKNSVKNQVNQDISQILKMTNPAEQLAEAYKLGNTLYQQYKRNPNNSMSEEMTKQTYHTPSPTA